MKLSKQSLMNALILATEKTASLMFAGAQNSLQDGTLEIEGYSRNEWVKFDPNDQKTFPPKNTVVLAMIRKELSGGASKKMSVDVFNEYHMPNWLGGTFTHWRPLPPPPVGKEEA